MITDHRSRPARTREEADWFNAAPPELGFVPDSEEAIAHGLHHDPTKPVVIDYGHTHVPTVKVKDEPMDDAEAEEEPLDLDDSQYLFMC